MRLSSAETWQEDAWRYFDEVGELRFAIGWVSNGLSRVNLVAATRPVQLGDEPAALRGEDELSSIDQQAIELVSTIAGGPDGQSQLLARLAVLLSVPGIGWLLIEEAVEPGEELSDIRLSDLDQGDEITVAPDATWTWRALSNEEIRSVGGSYEVASDVEDGEWRPIRPEHVLIKVWRSHPRRSSQPDSPCRATRTVLHQIGILDDHVNATGESRLAGAGLLVVPAEVEFAPVIHHPEADPEDDELAEDKFVDTLVETMTIPLGDRSSAAAVVPLVVKIPGEYVDKIRHITFWSEFSDALPTLQDRAIRRLALGLDMPPEIVTGVSGMNHWGAWQVQEEAVTLHIEPLAEIICHALTIGYLRPALEAAGAPVEESHRLMVWRDTTDLTTRPDRSDDALAAYDRVELSGAALRRESGLSESDKPDHEEIASRLLLRALDRAPQLADQLLPALGVDVEITPAPVTAIAPTPATETTPESPNLGPPAVAASALLEACDGLVHRELERAGSRLRAVAARGSPNGSSTVVCDDPALLHTQLEATSFLTSADLLRDAWRRVPVVAQRLGVDPEALTVTLDSYVRGLLANGHAHELDRLAAALNLIPVPTGGPS